MFLADPQQSPFFEPTVLHNSHCIKEVFKAMLNPEHGFQEQQMSKIATWQAVPVEGVH